MRTGKMCYHATDTTAPWNADNVRWHTDLVVASTNQANSYCDATAYVENTTGENPDMNT